MHMVNIIKKVGKELQSGSINIIIIIIDLADILINFFLLEGLRTSDGSIELCFNVTNILKASRWKRN
jgi:hypothetical protein